MENSLTLHGALIDTTVFDSSSERFGSVDGVEIDSDRISLVKDDYQTPIGIVTKVKRGVDKIFVEVKVLLFVDSFSYAVDNKCLYFAAGGKLLEKHQVGEGGIEPVQWVLDKVSINQVALTTNGISPSYLVKVGPLPEDIA